MRWDALFEDLAAQLEAESAAALDSAVDELLRMELAAIPLMDRLRAHVGSHVDIRLVGGGRVTGTLVRCGSDWILLSVALRAVLVPAAAIGSLTGPARFATPAGRVAFSLASALRALAADRASVSLDLGDGIAVDGVIDIVGRDYLELAVVPTGEQRRSQTVRRCDLVPLTAIRSVSSATVETSS